MGREPTSLGCHTCRQRRIRCDQAKPICARCRRAGYECQGYEKVFRQQNYGVHQNKEGSTSSTFIKLNYATSYPSRLGQEHSDGSRSRPDKTVNEARSSTLPEPTGHPLRDEGSIQCEPLKETTSALIQPEVILPSRLSLEPFLDHVTFSYFFDSYGWINIHSMLLQDSPMRQHLAQEHDALGYDSLRALTYGIFGRDHKISTLQRSASRIYGTLLQKLQNKLDTSAKSDLARLIKPIAIMGSYSIAVENDHRFTHHSGLSCILQHCGPRHFADASLLPIYESCRFTMVFLSSLCKLTSVNSSDSPGPLRLCQIFPDRDPYVDRHLSWNLNSARICESPIFSFGDNESHRGNDFAAAVAVSPSFGQHSMCSTSLAASTQNEFPQNILLPGDIRFSAQLRILNWLTSHLPESRTSVLSTLAAMGLTHCVHDVRPSEGNEDIAMAIRETMTKSQFQGAAELLLRKYR